MVSTLAFVFKIIRPIIFSKVKKVSFLQQRKFSTIKKISRNEGNFPLPRKFSTVKEIFYNQADFPQSSQSSTIKGIFHNQGNFLQTKTFKQPKRFSKS